MQAVGVDAESGVDAVSGVDSGWCGVDAGIGCVGKWVSVSRLWWIDCQLLVTLTPTRHSLPPG